MDFVNTAAEIERLLLECDISKEELSEIATEVPKPKDRKEGEKGGRKKVAGVVVQKYVDFRDYTSKESKMEYIIKHLLKSVPLDFILEMKKKKWLTVDYTRAYKTSIGGPMFLIGDMIKDGTSTTKGRVRLAEINGRFPIYALTTSLVAKHKTWKKAKTAKEEDMKIVLHAVEDYEGPSMNDLSELEDELFD